MKGWIYILKGETGKYYIGSTKDLERRIAQHSQGHTHSTKRMGTLNLVFSQEYPNLSEARKIELKIKKWKRKDYVEKIIKEGYIRIS